MSGLLASSALLLTYLCALHDPADANVPSQLKQRQKTHLIEFMKRHQILLPPDLDGKDDNVDKRQEFLFDDYGHMRFGKREESDDYGHLRFGRSHDE